MSFYKAIVTVNGAFGISFFIQTTCHFKQGGGAGDKICVMAHAREDPDTSHRASVNLVLPA